VSHIRVREFGGLATAAAAEPTEEMLAILSGPDYAGQPVKAEDVHARRMLLCHNHYDRTYERFPEEYLQRFAETLPGKSMLGNHNSMSMMPLGRFFLSTVTAKREQIAVPKRGRYRRRAEDGADVSAPVAADSKGADIVPGFESELRQVKYLDSTFFFANTPENEGLRSNIDLGVYRHVSIGYRFDDLICDVCKKSYFGECRHILGMEMAPEEEGGQMVVVTGTYGGDAQMAEAREGSIVYLGAQPNARLQKQVAEGRVNPKAIAATPYGEDLVALKEAEYLASVYGHDRKVYALGSIRELEADTPFTYSELSEGKVGLSLEDHTSLALGALDGLALRSQRHADARAEESPTLPVKHAPALQSLIDRATELLAKTAAPGAPEGSDPGSDSGSAEVKQSVLLELDVIRRRASVRAIGAT
jgi:hypothetical protein